MLRDGFLRFCDDPDIACCRAEAELGQLRTENAQLHAKLAELQELAKAKACGRLVVLPYPIGTKIYIIIRHGVLHDKIHENVVCGYSESEWQGGINKGKDSRFVICHNSYNMPNAYELRDVFLTREAAEKALEVRE